MNHHDLAPSSLIWAGEGEGFMETLPLLIFFLTTLFILVYNSIQENSYSFCPSFGE